jgi:hypothetical protein
MRRREFVTLLGGAVVAWQDKLPRIGARSSFNALLVDHKQEVKCMLICGGLLWYYWPADNMMARIMVVFVVAAAHQYSHKQ